MFRVQGTHIFLTYAQAEDIPDKETLLSELRNLVPTPIAWAIGKEQHEDGGQHYHVLLKYESRIDIRNERFWDVNGHHPNIQKCRSPKQVLRYVIKDGDTLVHGFDIQHEDDIFAVLLEEMLNGTNATTVIKNTVARTGTKGLRLYNQIQAYSDRMMKPSVKHDAIMHYPVDFMGINEILMAKITKFSEDVAQGVAFRGDRKSLWLYGPSRMGKTMLARSLGTHWYMMSAWNVDAYDDDAEYGVMDDLPWESLSRYYKGMLGCQLDITVTDKYKKKSVIQHGRPVIVLTNELPVFSVAEAAWLEANVEFHFVHEKVWV